jgi:hypothetical protein
MQFKHLKSMLAEAPKNKALNEAVKGPGFFQEARSYSDSGEFTEEFYELFTQVTKMKKVMKHPKWLDWMEMTDRNFGSNVEESAKDAIRAVSALEDALTDIDRAFDTINGHDSAAFNVMDDDDDLDADKK